MRHILLITALLFSIAFANAAPPIASADCGTGALVVGSKNAGKVYMGTDSAGSCTLTFSWPKVPSCSAVNETSSPGPKPLGTITTETTLAINSPVVFVIVDGDVISYLCIGQ